MKSKPKKVTERRLKVYFPAWMYTVHVVFSSDVRHTRGKIALSRKQIVDCGSDYEACHIAFRDDEDKSWLVFDHNPGNSVVAHEAWHAVRRMLLVAGAELDNETVAHHLGYLVKKITLSLMAEDKKKRKR